MRNRASTVSRMRWLTLAVGVFFVLTVPRARALPNDTGFEGFVLGEDAGICQSPVDG